MMKEVSKLFVVATFIFVILVVTNRGESVYAEETTVEELTTVLSEKETTTVEVEENEASTTVEVEENEEESVKFVEPKKVTKLTVYRSSGAKKNRDDVLLQWRKQEGASYKIYRSRKKNGTYKKVGTLKNSYWIETDYKYVQWVDTNVKTGKKYYYKVVAYKKNPEGDTVYGSYSKKRKAKVIKAKKTDVCYGSLKYVNKKRKAEGYRPILWDFRANGDVKVRAKEISVEFSHTRPNGEDCMTAYKGYLRCSENIACGEPNYKWAIDDWMESDGHRIWLLCAYTEDIKVGKYPMVTELGERYEPGEAIPGNVCGMALAKKGDCFVYVVTVIKEKR